METKPVHFLLCIFVFYLGAPKESVPTPEIHTVRFGKGFRFPCVINYIRKDLTEVKVIFNNTLNNSVILHWRLKGDGSTLRPNISKEYKGNLEGWMDGRKEVNISIKFHSAKFENSGIYWCRIENGNKEEETKKIHVYVYETQVKISWCNDRGNLLFQCNVINWHIKPKTIEFCWVSRDENYESCQTENILFKIRNASEYYYNISAKQLVHFTNIPKDLMRWRVKFENDEELNMTKTVTEETIDRNFVPCLPRLEMENPRRWLKVGEKNITFRCIFDVPHGDRISKILWYHDGATKIQIIYKWPIEGQSPEKNYVDDSFASAPPVEYKGRIATTVTLKTVMLNHAGICTCNLTFSEYEYGNQSATADLDVYQLEKPNFTAIGCTDQKVDLECKATNVYPKPDEISLSIYNPNSQSPVKLKRNVSSEIKNGLYDISIKMTTVIDQSGFDESPNISCDVILSGKSGTIKETNWTKRKTYVLDSEGIRTDVCKAKVEMDQTLQWLRVGQTPVFQCKFILPDYDEIKSVVWIHRNFSYEDILYKWEKKTNNPTITGRWKNEIRDESSLIPSVIDYRRVTTLKLKNATFDYNGNYSCQVNFGLAAGHTATAILVIYDLPKRFYFKATRCGDNQTVGLECKAHNIRPKPEEIAFYVYNPSDSSWSRIDSDVYIRIAETNGSFAISAKTIASSKLFSNVTSKAKAKCEVILHRDIKETNVTDLAEPDASSNRECSPNVRADKHRIWEKVGKDVVLQCTFDVPFRRHISSVEWIRQNVSGALITWEASTNKVKVGKTTDMSFVMTQDHEGRNATTLKIENAKLRHSDNYTCHINYGRNSSQWDTLLLVIYKIEKPYYFKTLIHGNFEDGLVCKAGNIFPRPLGIVFWKYNPVTNLTAKLDNKILTEIIPVGEFFNVSAEMIVEYSGSERVVYVCHVLLSEDPEILETTSIEQFGSEDISATPSPTSKGKISTVAIIAGGVVGALLLAVVFAYLLYVCIWKRLCFRDYGNKEEEEEEEAIAAYFGWLFNCW